MASQVTERSSSRGTAKAPVAAKKGASIRKRKRNDGSNSSNNKHDWRREQDKYYERLMHGAQKDLRKQAKIVRTFECQKMIRKIKERKENKNDKTGSTVAPAKEETYEQLKQFSLEPVVQESLRRLGIFHLNPKLDPKRNEETDDGDSHDSNEGEQEETEEKVPSNSDQQENNKSKTDDNKSDLTEDQLAMLERILKHKKMQTALESWNDKVTEYRRWSLQQQEKVSGANKFNDLTDTSSGKKKRKKKGGADQVATMNSYKPLPPEKSLFVRLGGAQEGENGHNSIARNDDDDVDDEMPHYGPAGSSSFVEQKKNRPGQRARKAKAMAIEAKKAGRSHRAAESVNWRPKKQQQQAPPEDDNGNRNSAYSESNRQNEKVENNEAPKKKEDALHPSWAAKKEKKDGIVQFQGTKITF